MANNNFGGNPFGGNPGMTNSFGPVQPMPISNPSLSIMASNTREFAEQYPLAPNATMVFINYNQKKIWIKTMHANGLSYDFEDFNMLSDNDLAQYQQQVQNSVQQIQNGNFVQRVEFDNLMSQFQALQKSTFHLLI